MKRSIKIRIIFTITVTVAFLSYFNPQFVEYRHARRFFYNKFNGVVTDRFIDENNHNDRSILVSTSGTPDKIVFSTPQNNRDIYEFISLGDSIIKNVGSFEVRIKGNAENDLDTVLTIEAYNRYIFFFERRNPVRYHKKEQFELFRFLR